MTDQMGMDCKAIVHMNQKVADGGPVSPRGSPRMRSKAKSISWLKQTLQNAGCVINEGDKDSHVIDDCFQVSLPVLQKYSATLVRTNVADNILNSMAFSDIVKNIWALRSEYVIKIAKPILQKLMSHDRNRNTFNEPVDPVALGIPAYFSVVKEPMDLGTVMAKLRSRRYATIKACFHDIELVFNNAMLFNHATHEVHKMARDLMKEFHADVAAAEEKCTKESERRAQHNCSLCCGSTCQLCGEKCLKYEPPSLNCQQCGTRVKKNGIFYVCADGSALWCQKCYVSLPPVIVAGAPRPLDRGDTPEVPETPSGGLQHSSSVLALAEDTATSAAAAAAALEGDLPCAISSCDSESLHDAAVHANAGSVHSDHRAGTTNSFLSSGQDDAPLLKRNLLKRRADEEVAEPWVACDSCGNWYHQICALYSKLGESSAAKSFCCPFCVLLASDGADPSRCLVDVSRGGVAGLRRHDSFAECARSRAPSTSAADEGTAIDTASTAPVDPVVTSSLVLSLVPPPTPVPASSGQGSSSRLHRGLTVKFEPEDTLFKNIFEYSELSAPHSLACTPKHDRSTAQEREDVSTLVDPLAQLSDTTAMLVDSGHVAFVSANSSCAGTGLTSEDERLLDDESIHGAASCEASVVVTTVSCAVMDTAPDTAMDTAVDTVTFAEPREEQAGAVSDREAAGTPMVEPIPPPPVGTADTAGTVATSEAVTNSVRAALDTHWKWRASSLPHTQLGDFLQALVQDLLVANGHADAARTVTVRMTTNRDMPLEVPASIVQNMVSPTGHVIPTCLGYKQKCILLFQEIDGVDVCIFSLYVHEFDASCPSPNTSTVYIAYLDSVDFFRPVAARTMVYQELVAGYLKWSQMRGFKQAHIWSCPPHRGDNFIFNAHPAHQKYPSRERLNQWYKAILQRCSRVGIIAETGNLWQQYFSKYARRDALPVARQAALNSFVGSGKAQKKSNYKAKGKLAGAAAVASAAARVSVAQDASSTEAAVSTESSASSAGGVGTAIAAVDVPVCPPIFDGDYWVQQYVYLVRLHTQRGKASSTAAQRQQLGLRKVRELLKRLMQREESDPFLHPVDHIALDIPNYTLIVKQPMDFSTVKEKLHAGEYPTAAEFAKDVRLIFSNAKLFNPPHHAVHLAADSLAQRFERGLQLVVNELKEASGGNSLLRAPIPQPGQDGAHGSSSETEAFLATVVLSFTAAKEATTAAAADAAAPPPVTTSVAGTGEESAVGAKSPGKRTCDELYRTPPCTTVSRSASLVDEKEFFAATAADADKTAAAVPKPEPPVTPLVRSRSQSISITPVAQAAAGSTGSLQLLPPPKEVEVEALSDWEMVVEVEGEDDALRRVQRVVSQDFTVTSARSVVASDDKRKAAENEGNAESTESASKRRRLSVGETVSVTSATTSVAATSQAAPGAAPVADKYQNFSAAAVNAAHVPTLFTAPALGSQNAMTIVAELSKRMQRQYDDLFVIKLAPPSVPAPEVGAGQAAAEGGADAAPVTAAAPVKKMRGRVAAAPKKTPAMHVPGGLKSLGPACQAMLAALIPDTSDPDPAIHSPVTDSRHVFLELCQFRHYQFDSLRRAKHSSLMLLYHLQNPLDKRCHPCCSHCDAQIHTLRWHCDECPDFDLCGNCYNADMARRVGPPPMSRRTSFSVDTSETLEPVLDGAVGSGALVHPHVLTPYRVSHHW